MQIYEFYERYKHILDMPEDEAQCKVLSIFADDLKPILKALEMWAPDVKIPLDFGSVTVINENFIPQTGFCTPIVHI